jgi:hypothetical protein
MRICLSLSVAVALLMAATLPAPADDQADITALFGKAIKAMGGEEKVSKLQAVSWNGKVEHRLGEKTLTMVLEASVQGWDKYRVAADMQAGGASRKLLVVINGSDGWGQENMGDVKDLPKEALPFWRDSLYPVRVLHLLTRLKSNDFRMSPLGELKIGDKEAVGVQVAHKDHKDVSLFFDKVSGLPLKSETRLMLPSNKEIAVEYHLSDYKEFDGLKHFSKITVKADGKDFVIELSELRAHEKLDDTLFAKP